jgi:hypothetical protein
MTLSAADSVRRSPTAFAAFRLDKNHERGDRENVLRTHHLARRQTALLCARWGRRPLRIGINHEL